MIPKIVSFGAGVQSTALLCLAAQDKIDYRDFFFSNVGDDSESPLTLQYFREHHIPYAAKHGLNLYEVRKTRRDGQQISLYQTLINPKSKSIGIPVRMAGSGAMGRRLCTVEYKARLCEQWLKKERGIKAILDKERGYVRMAEAIRGQMVRAGLAAEDAQSYYDLTIACIKMPRPLAIVALGFSTDEFHRAKNDSGVEWKQFDYPLLDLDISRQKCFEIIKAAGLPPPPESSCWFCPFHTTQRWQTMRREEPAQFYDASELEQLLYLRSIKLGRGGVYLHRSLKFLSDAIPDQPLSTEELHLERQEQCVEGGCFL